MEKLRFLAEYARSLDVSMATLTLAIMLHMPGMGPVIPAASGVQQLEQNAAAAKLSLSPEQLEQICSAARSPSAVLVISFDLGLLYSSIYRKCSYIYL